ncbi:MAG: ATP/GTP-binding protein [Leptolyngbyaceae cyanobacterium]
MEVMRLVVTGPVGAGKSTFIQTISEIKVVNTDRCATDETAQLKKNTTVALDFGRLQFSPDMVLHLYGTPGQTRFDFMWDLLIRKTHAYIMLVPSHRPAEFQQARRMINFMGQRTVAPMVVGLTHGDCDGAWSADSVMGALGLARWQNPPAVVGVNTNDPKSVAKAVIALLQQYSQQASQQRSLPIGA